MRVPPHPRGWTAVLTAAHRARTGFPAHAGMELLALIRRTPAERDRVALRKALENDDL